MVFFAQRSTKSSPPAAKAAGTSKHAASAERGVIRTSENAIAENEVLKRIKRWKNGADGMFPNAVKALDHYLDRTGTFVEIPSSKTESVKKEAEANHRAKAIRAFKMAAALEAGSVWNSLKGFPTNGGELKPKKIDFVLTWQSGESAAGLSDDNLTYYGSTIMSEVQFTAEQISIPPDAKSECDIEIKVVTWKSWVVDNYDWEGDKSFGIFAMLGLPTQKEMNSLQQSGLAKSYQRSSRSWNVTNHGLAPWNERIGSLVALKDVGANRSQAKLQREKDRKKEHREGALPTPRPAEEVLKAN